MRGCKDTTRTTVRCCADRQRLRSCGCGVVHMCLDLLAWFSRRTSELVRRSFWANFLTHWRRRQYTCAVCSRNCHQGTLWEVFYSVLPLSPCFILSSKGSGVIRNLLEAMTLRVQNAWHTASEMVCHSVVNMLVSIAALAERSKRMTQVSTSTEWYRPPRCARAVLQLTRA